MVSTASIRPDGYTTNQQWKGAWRMRRGWIAAIILALGFVGIPAKAAQTGQVRVALDFADGEVRNGAVTLYYVGQKKEVYYLLNREFGGGLVKLEDAQSPALAMWLSESAETEGTPRILDADGTAWFSGLQEGLYLLVQSEPIEGVDPFAPMLLPIPFNGSEELAVYPQYRLIVTQIPHTGDHPAPVLGAMGMVLTSLALVICFDKRHRK